METSENVSNPLESTVSEAEKKKRGKRKRANSAEIPPTENKQLAENLSESSEQQPARKKKRVRNRKRNKNAQTNKEIQQEIPQETPQTPKQEKNSPTKKSASLRIPAVQEISDAPQTMAKEITTGKKKRSRNNSVTENLNLEPKNIPLAIPSLVEKQEISQPPQNLPAKGTNSSRKKKKTLQNGPGSNNLKSTHNGQSPVLSVEIQEVLGTPKNFPPKGIISSETKKSPKKNIPTSPSKLNPSENTPPSGNLKSTGKSKPTEKISKSPVTPGSGKNQLHLI